MNTGNVRTYLYAYTNSILYMCNEGGYMHAIYGTITVLGR